MSFSSDLKAYREKHSYTQARMAEIMGISPRMYQYYERGDYDGAGSKVEYYSAKLALYSESNADQTVGDAFDLQQEAIAALKGQIAVMEKYIDKLERELAAQKT